jgi:anti-sigma factor RsiW
VPFSSEHPSEWTLELYAEEALPPAESALLASHVDVCVRCAGEVATLRSLFHAMESLPRFSPSPAFADSVMSRVRLAPQHSPLYAWLLRALPSTRRGWILFLGLAAAPALPIIALVAWLLTNTSVTLSGLWSITTAWANDAAWSLLVATTGAVVESNALATIHSVYEQLLAVPLPVLLTGLLVVTVGIPLSAWTLYRTLRTPDRGTAYAL